MNNDQVSGKQFTGAMIAMMLAEAFGAHLRGVAFSASTAAPWALLLAGGLAFLLVWPIAAQLSRRSGHNLIDLCLDAGGRPLAIAAALVFAFQIIATLSLSLRQIAEMAITAAYPHTPQTFLISTLLLAGVCGARISPPGLVWFGYVWAMPMLLAILVIVVGAWPWGKLSHLMPPTGPGLLTVTAELVPMTSYFSKLSVLFVLCSYLKSPRRLVSYTVGAGAVVTATWALAILVFLMVFPMPDGLSVPFPLFDLTQLLMFGRFLERLDALWMLFWAVGGAIGLSTGLMAAALMWRDAFRLPSHREAVLPLAAAILATSLFPSNQATALDYEIFFLRRWGFVTALLIPLLIALAAQARRRSNRAH